RRPLPSPARGRRLPQRPEGREHSRGGGRRRAALRAPPSPAPPPVPPPRAGAAGGETRAAPPPPRAAGGAGPAPPAAPPAPPPRSRAASPPGAGGATRRGWTRLRARRTARRARGPRPVVPPPRFPAVTCTVICQNEERLLARCLESVAWCDEIVVVDGGSTDDTLGIARRFGGRILMNPWPGYRAQKQTALDAARGEWVLNVDADERVTPELAAEIRSALARVPSEVAGFAIPRLVCYLGRWWYRGGWYPRPIVRLVRRPGTRWGGTDPHERAEVTGRIARLRWPLLHYTYTDISDHLRSLNKLTSVAAGQPKLPARIGTGRLVAEPSWRLVRSYLVQRGFLDG